MKINSSMWDKEIYSWKTRLIVIVFSLIGASGQNLTTCCEKAVDPCKSVCEKMSLSNSSVLRDDEIQYIYKFCSHDLTEFWICMNQTVQKVISGSSWWGGACCSHAWSPPCREACPRAVDSRALTPACRQSDETALFECVQKQTTAQWCCSQTISPSCQEACQSVLWKIGYSQIDRAAKSRAFDVCDQSPQLLQCLTELTTSEIHDDTSKYLPCCNETSSLKCRSTCESILRQTGESQEIADALNMDCGAPVLHDSIWQCFLRKDSVQETKDMIPHDVAKLHCCQKATTINCKKLCYDTFNTETFNNWQKFYNECSGEPQEMELSQCIEEVSASCSLGCSGLSYCSQLNARPTSLFRACSRDADHRAHTDHTLHTHTSITIAGFELPVKNSSQCTTDVWKGVLCALHVKPCTAKGHSSLICYSDCVRVVSACVWWSRAPPSLTAPALCRRLAPADQHAPCVALADYITPSTEPALLLPSELITSPCSYNPCKPSQICVVNRHQRYGGNSKYTCIDGCPLGANSPVLIPVGSWALVPMTGADNNNCFRYKICRCGKKGLGNCQPLPCVPVNNCKLHMDKVYMSGQKYYLECNPCACVSGERLCAARACGRGGARAGLPCRCPPHYLPAAAPGRAFPNACLAKCAGATDAMIEFGVRSPCDGVSCPRRHMCLPRRNVCLPNGLKQECEQHLCVSTSNCTAQPSSPACDSDGHTHDNPCRLIMSGQRFAYWGHCLTGCNKVGPVCGVNGVTYSSECAAWAEYISVDYSGPCAAVGYISDAMEHKCEIDHITCPPLKKPKCKGFTAPGACCPKCGGALRILYSKKHIDRALYGTNMSSAVISLTNILKALDREVKTAECALRGFLTIETEIVIIVETILDDPTDLQLNICVLEAERLADIINRESALFSSDLGLSALSYALPIHTYPTQGANNLNISIITLMLAALINCVLR